MSAKVRTIEVDATTADTLQSHAAARGISVGELVAQLVASVDSQTAPDESDIAELDRQWTAIEAGEPTEPHEQVARWLETWGTSSFKPWPQR
jgi:predicted transcriptional regulator